MWKDVYNQTTCYIYNIIKKISCNHSKFIVLVIYLFKYIFWNTLWVAYETIYICVKLSLPLRNACFNRGRFSECLKYHDHYYYHVINWCKWMQLLQLEYNATIRLCYLMILRNVYFLFKTRGLPSLKWRCTNSRRLVSQKPVFDCYLSDSGDCFSIPTVVYCNAVEYSCTNTSINKFPTALKTFHYCLDGFREDRNSAFSPSCF